MTCHDCQRKAHKHGRDRHGRQRFMCVPCRRTFTEPREKPLGDMRIPMDKAVLAISLLVEGNSIRSTERITGLDQNTIMRLLKLVGNKCQRLLDSLLRDLECRFLEADEAWCFVQKKQKQLKATDPPEYGDQYVFVCIESETKLVISHAIGKRDTVTTNRFLADISKRVKNRPQLTTDGFSPYLEAVEDSFGADIDFAMLIKQYHGAVDPGRERYSPGGLTSITKKRISGDPEMEFVSTSYIERQNLTLRMGCRRFTRLTNAFSKKLENLKAAVALHFAHYNLCRVHRTLECTPAMEAKITDHIWSLEELLQAA